MKLTLITVSTLLWAVSVSAAASDKPQAAEADGGIYGAFAASQEWTPPKDPAVLANLRRWQDEKLGLLIHWGTYSQWGIVESWSLVTTKHPWNNRPPQFTNLTDQAYKQVYEGWQTTFNPTNFHPGKWAAAAKDAGVKYMIITTKHHDGFCLWDTATTDYKITSARCPFHTDPRADAIKTACDAFRHAGLATGLYFSKADWNNTNFWLNGTPGAEQGPNYDPPEHPANWRQFKEFTWQQIAELVSGYGPQQVLWLDAGAVRPPNAGIDMDGLAAMAREHQPGLIVVDRTVHGPNENYVTPEGEIPDHYLPYPWETCMTMGSGWTWRPADNFKSDGTLIRNLCRIVARNGNYLIGIGPDGKGEFDPTVYDRLKEMGAWLKVNGEAIYATRPIQPYEQGDWVFTTKQDGTVYAILLAKDDHAALPDKISLPPELLARARRITLLGGGEVEAHAAGEVEIPVDRRATLPSGGAWVFKLSRPDKQGGS
jgi:alpha-L-fucosidase